VPNTKLLCATLCIGFAIALASCGLNPASTPQSTLVGKWAEVNGPDKIEFTSAGAFAGNMAYGMGGGQQAIAGKYFVDGENISIDLERDHPMTWTFHFSDGDLVVKYQQGGAVKMDGSMAKFRKSK
jgi:hypothetical protein